MKIKIILTIGVLFLLGVIFFVSNNVEVLPFNKANTSLPSPTSEVTSVACSGETLPELTEGPYYIKGSPMRTDIRDNSSGEAFLLTGYVLDTNCQPIAHAWIDFWQADSSGNYDNIGYQLRGHQYSDENGKYVLQTVIPGEYPGRTPHIHLKIRAMDTSKEYTSQLFLPGVSTNEGDSIFHDALVVKMSEGESGTQSTYNFVIQR